MSIILIVGKINSYQQHRDKTMNTADEMYKYIQLEPEKLDVSSDVEYIVKKMQEFVKEEKCSTTVVRGLVNGLLVHPKSDRMFNIVLELKKLGFSVKYDSMDNLVVSCNKFYKTWLGRIIFKFIY